MRTVISLRVSVPVLSEQITETEPSVSTAGSRRMMALRAAMRWTPTASVIVMTAGRPSGNRRDGEPDHDHERSSSGVATRESRRRNAATDARSATVTCGRKVPSISAQQRRRQALDRADHGADAAELGRRCPVATATPVPWPATTKVPE
jgi:hypothetical protein